MESDSSACETSHSSCGTLLRDHDTGFVQLVLATADDLIIEHPRMDVRLFRTLPGAQEVRASYGSPPVCGEPW